MDPALLARLALLTAILAISSPTIQSRPAATNPSTYVVQAGDTLFSIATRFNTTVDALTQANNLTNPNALTAGQTLNIPSSSPSTAIVTPTAVARGPTPTTTPGTLTYTVQAGDTLALIARQFGVTVEQLALANNLQDINVLSVGQVLTISQGAPAASPYPPGIALTPSVVKQGTTVELKIADPGIVSATGKFDQQGLHFVKESDGLRALIGITRCANYVGEYPVALTLRDTKGNTRSLNFKVRVNPTQYPIYDLTLTSEMSALLDPAIVNAENKRVAETVAPYNEIKLWNGVFRSPLAVKNPRMSSTFGERRSYNGGTPGQCGHEGSDFAVPEGTPVYAPADGIVAMASKLNVRGNIVLLNHGQGVYSGFFHLSQINVKPGQRVQAGDVLGLVGTTGFSTGDHLHWSLWVNGIYVNPLEWTTRDIQ